MKAGTLSMVDDAVRKGRGVHICVYSICASLRDEKEHVKARSDKKGAMRGVQGGENSRHVRRAKAVNRVLVAYKQRKEEGRKQWRCRARTLLSWQFQFSAGLQHNQRWAMKTSNSCAGKRGWCRQ